jgi:hypothetical protein
VQAWVGSTYLPCGLDGFGDRRLEQRDLVLLRLVECQRRVVECLAPSLAALHVDRRHIRHVLGQGGLEHLHRHLGDGVHATDGSSGLLLDSEVGVLETPEPLQTSNLGGRVLLATDRPDVVLVDDLESRRRRRVTRPEACVRQGRANG